MIMMLGGRPPGPLARRRRRGPGGGGAETPDSDPDSDLEICKKNTSISH